MILKNPTQHLKKYWFYSCLAYSTVDHTGRNNHKYRVTRFHQVLACARLDLSQAHIMAPPPMTMIAAQSSLESHLPGPLPSPTTSSPTDCGIVCREFVFSKPECTCSIEKFPMPHVLYLKGFKFAVKQTKETPTINNLSEMLDP